ncbi:hypothetical protein [Chamaesiphon sp.]|uniref:hypothetical protein n=1 Tax=Chamaesiphon sp. TaxID=2814140 RepID=UPI00359312D0
MSKLTSLAIGLLTAMAIFPAAQAMAATHTTSTLPTPSADLQAQVIFKIGPQYRRGYDSNWEYRYRRAEWERKREARDRWRSDYYRDRDYRRDDRRDYRRDYRYYR